MKYIITGGCGFIGSNTIKHLLNKNDKDTIIVLDNVINNKINNVEYHNVDISNFDEIVKYFNNVDYVIHLAALSNTNLCIENPLLCNKINVTGTINILEACRMNNVKKVVCASSHVVLDGMHPLRMSKITVENYCEMYHKLYNLPVVCLRYSAVYGKGQTGSNVLNAFKNSIEKNGYITIFGNGEQKRDLLHISDCVRANILAINSNYYGILDICTGKNYSLNYIAEKLFKSKIIYKDARCGDAELFNQLPEKAKNILNFVYNIELEEGIKDYI